MSKSKWLEIKNVQAYIDNNIVFNSLNLDLYLNDNTIVIGPNGSGKSTLVKLINRSIYPIAKNNSYINLFESKVKNIWDLRSKIGLVSTEIENRINSKHTVYDVTFSGFYGVYSLTQNLLPNSEQNYIINETLNNLDLTDVKTKRYAELSDGLKKRTIIARSLVHKPKVLIFDEPTSMLDIKSKQCLLSILSELSHNGTTLLMITHDMSNIIKEISRIIFMKAGKIIDEGSPAKLLTTDKLSKLYDIEISANQLKSYIKN